MGKAGLESCPLLFKISAGVRHNHRSDNGLLNKKADGLMNPQRKSRREKEKSLSCRLFLWRQVRKPEYAADSGPLERRPKA